MTETEIVYDKGTTIEITQGIGSGQEIGEIVGTGIDNTIDKDNGTGSVNTIIEEIVSIDREIGIGMTAMSFIGGEIRLVQIGAGITMTVTGGMALTIQQHPTLLIVTVVIS